MQFSTEALVEPPGMVACVFRGLLLGFGSLFANTHISRISSCEQKVEAYVLTSSNPPTASQGTCLVNTHRWLERMLTENKLIHMSMNSVRAIDIGARIQWPVELPRPLENAKVDGV
jgi:hypothetical protein